MTQPRGSDGYIPLREYAAIGDGRTVALVASDGQIDWLPMPALHTPPVFAGLIDAGRGGRFELRPRGDFTSSRAYVDGTNVLATRFETATGTAVVTDALVTGVAGRLPWSELARRIDGERGEVTFDWIVVPGNVFGTEPVRRLDSLHGPTLRAGGINLALVGFEHGRLDPIAPGRGDSAGPLDFHGTFTTAAGLRSLPASAVQTRSPSICRTRASWTRASTAASPAGSSGRTSSAGTGHGPMWSSAVPSPSSS